MLMRRIVDRFEIAARHASSQDELAAHIAAATAEMGFDHFALLHHQSLASDRADLVRIDNYPGRWADELASRGLIGVDPVHQASLRSNIGFAWSELSQLVKLDAQSRYLLQLARGFGIGDGFTVPANVPGEPCGSCSFAVAPDRPLPLHNLLSAEQVGAHAFRAARRIAGFPRRDTPPRLSRRERQCVRLIALGKTDWEIAAILAISIETAHQYVKRARAAYDVVSRAQLVACGLRDFVVTYDEAIPPSG